MLRQGDIMLILLILLWIIFNGSITVEIACFGIGITIAMAAALSIFTDYSIKMELKILRKLPLLLVYVFVLLIEIIKANIVCSFFILRGNKNIQPALVSFPSPLKSEKLSTILANSITLTPGTISVSMRTGRFSVHCLDKSMYEGITDSSFVRILKMIEK